MATAYQNALAGVDMEAYIKAKQKQQASKNAAQAAQTAVAAAPAANAVNTPALPTATAAAAAAGAVPDWVKERQAAQQQKMAEELAIGQRANAISSGNTGAITQAQNNLTNVRNQNAYQKAVSQAMQATQPTQKDYLFFGSQDPNFKLGMSDEDRASWDAIGKKYAAGDSSWNQDTNSFREDGNLSGYYDDSGNYNGWLRAVDGTGGYTPAFGGKVGETGYAAGTAFYAPDGTVYTLGADGSLAKSGNATTVKYGSYIGPKSGYQDSEFWALNSDGQYQRYTNQTAPDEVLEAQGYYRDQNGLVMPIGDEYYIAKGIQNGQITPEQAELAKLARTTNNDTAKTAQAMAAYTGNENAPKPVQTAPQTVQPSVINSGSSTIRETAPTIPQTNIPQQTTPQTVPQNTQQTAPQTTVPQATPQAQYTPPAENAYQQYLDQWYYEKSPEWNENPPETWRDMQNYDYGQAPEYQGSPYDQQRDDALAAAGEKWTPSEYQQKRDDALARAERMQFNYDPNTDPNWQAYQKQYRREGDRAMQEAMAQAAMRTGGLANSYAVTAATQAGNYYASQLSDKLPQLYNDAYNRYLQEFQKQLGISDQYQGFDDREYSRWADQQGRNFDLADRYNQYGQQDYSKYQDTLDQYNRDRNFQYGVNRDAVSDELNNYNTRYNQYQDRLGQYNTDRNFDYGRYRDAVGDARYADETQYDRAWNEDERSYNRAWNEDARQYDRAWNEENRDYTRNYQAQRDAVNDQRYDQEWAQQLREYADSQNWKAKDWEQYLREYEDKLSNQEREWAYQQYRDAVSDARYNQEYADNRGDTKWKQALTEQEYADEQDWKNREWDYGVGRDEVSDAWNERKYSDAMKMTALDYLNANDIVTGIYAEILGVPDGTTYEQYYSRYLGGSTSPFEETEIPSGKTQRTTTPPPLYDPEGQVEPETDPEIEPETKQPPERTDIMGTHKNGEKKTRGYDELAHYLAVQTRGGYNADFIRQTVYQWAAEDRIADWEIPIVLSELGLWNQSNPAMNPNYEGSIRQYTN